MSIGVFISHITDDAPTASRLNAALTADFLGQLAVFQSSDTDSIRPGSNWFKSLGDALRASSALIVLCSPDATSRPWVNFEAGAAWILNIPVIPACFAGLRPPDLPMPFSAQQAVDLGDEQGLRRLYGGIAQILGCLLPQRDYAALAEILVAPPEPTQARPEPAGLGADAAIRERIDEILNHPRYKWRSLDKVAAAAAIPADSAAAILQVDERVRFSKGKSGNLIVGLRSRVG